MEYESLFDNSYKRVMDKKHNFFNVFYQNLLSVSPVVTKYFEKTQMDKQIKMMEKSFYKLFIFYATKNSDDHLEQIAIKHNKHHLNIEPYLYDIWLECIIDTVKKLDSKCNAEIELAWRLILAPGITYMKFMYDK